ncbi:MAG TPA: hypothetical protein VFS46_09050 [Nitrososphaera sp.]|nr:hypothetical protein [Nitrososphaera sp.]
MTEDSKYFVVIEIRSEEPKKPYFVRDKFRAYVRVGSSSEPASRSNVVNLFSSLRSRIDEVDKLRINCKAAKDSLFLALQMLHSTDNKSSNSIAPVDLTFLKHAVLNAEWFLIKMGLMGEVKEHGQSKGVYAVLRDLEGMNALIEGYNRLPSPHDKAKVLLYLNPWIENESRIISHMAFLQSIIDQCSSFLKEKLG